MERGEFRSCFRPWLFMSPAGVAAPEDMSGRSRALDCCVEMSGGVCDLGRNAVQSSLDLLIAGSVTAIASCSPPFPVVPAVARCGPPVVARAVPRPSSPGSTRHIATTAEEFRATPDTMAQAGAVRGLGNRPLAVVTAGEQDPEWLALQNELAALSTNSGHHVVDGATHTSVVDDPGHARVTSAAIVGLVDAVRNNRPLAR